MRILPNCHSEPAQCRDRCRLPRSPCRIQATSGNTLYCSDTRSKTRSSAIPGFTLAPAIHVTRRETLQNSQCDTHTWTESIHQFVLRPSSFVLRQVLTERTASPHQNME